MSENKLDILIRTEAELDEMRQAIARMKELDSAAKTANTEIADTAGKAAVSTKGLREALRGAAGEFPALGRMARLLNPVSASVAGLIAAFTIWRERMKNAVDVLAGMKIPDISDDRLRKYKEAASAWETFSANVRKAADAYNSVAAAGERAEKAIDRQADRERKRLENQKKVELADLELRRGGMSDGHYAAEQARIENRYELGENAIQDRAEQRKLAERRDRLERLNASARTKYEQAAGMTPGSEEREAELERRYRLEAEEAIRDKKEREQRLGRLLDMSASPWERAKWTPWYAMQYGPTVHGFEAREMERSGIASANQVLAHYDNFMAGKSARADLRRRRAGLLDQAAQDAGAGYVLGAELPGAAADFAYDMGLRRESAAANSFSRLAGSAGKGVGDGESIRAAAVRAIESGHGLSRAMLETLDAIRRDNEALAEQIRTARSQLSNGRAR